jgi:DNA-binding response OmpR family regulator
VVRTQSTILERGRILVVEDEPAVQKMLVQILEGPGYQIDTADDGAAALEKIEIQPYDLVILDRMIPNISGDDVLRHLKAAPETASIPVLFLTAVSDESGQVQGLDAGAADYIVKPFIPSILLARVRLQLRLKAQEDELQRQRQATEEQNVQLMIKNAELERLEEFVEDVLTPLGDPVRDNLARLVARIDDIRVEGVPDGAQSYAEDLRALAPSFERILHYHDHLARTDAALKGKRVLVVDSDPLPRNLAQRAVFATGASVKAAANIDAGLELLRGGPYDVMFVDWTNAKIIDPALELQPRLQCVVMTSQPVFEGNGLQMLQLPLSSVFITNVLARTAAHDPIAVREIVATAGKLLSQDIFGLEKYLGWGAALREVKISDSRARHDLIDEIHAYAIKAGLRKKFAQQLQTVADELIMNAIWDAPVDAAGVPKYNSAPRDQRIRLLPDEEVVVRFGSDANSFGISVTDKFGRLEYDRAVDYLVRCFAKDDDKINFGPGGAGLGLFMAYNSVSSFVVNVAPGRRTEVIGLLHMHRLDPEKLASSSRSFCFFRTKSGDSDV